MNKKTVIIGFAFIFVIILAFLFLNFNFPAVDKQELPSPEIEPVRSDEDVAFNFLAQVSPIEEASVYEYSSVNVVPQTYARLWNFSSQPEIEGNVYFWQNVDRQLNIDIDTLAVNFSRDLIVSPIASSGPALDAVDAFKLLQQYLESKDLWSSLFKLNPSYTTFRKSGVTLASEAGQQESNITEIGVDAYIGGNLIYNRGNSFVPRIKAWVSSDKEIVKLDYYLLGTVGDSVGDYPLRTPGEVQKDVVAGKAALAALEGSTEINITENIVMATISRASLSYLQPLAGENLLQPVYVFRGPAEFISGATTPAIYFLPAISSELLK